MPNHSVLFRKDDNTLIRENTDIPEFFMDLNLDQVFDAITVQKPEYNLKPFFFSPLNDVDAIKYRQEIFQDLEVESLITKIKSFAEKMVLTYRYINLASKLNYKFHKEGWVLEAALIYCEAVCSLADDLKQSPIQSRGLVDFLNFIEEYANSQRFTTLNQDTKELKTKLESIQYNVLIKGDWVRVRKYESEIDYSTEVERTFEKFKQGKVKNYRVNLIVSSGMNHVEAQILGCVAKLYPDIFEELISYFLQHHGFIDETVQTFDRQIQFYISYLEFIKKLKSKGLEFCYPKVLIQEKTIHANETYDIALANLRLFDQTPMVCNNFYLEGKERIIVVSGPNQGGKTTFARMFGQLHYLASLGCPVPGTDAQLFLFDQIFTHFEKEEDIRNLRGKLQDDLVRIHSILTRATSNSIIILNEIFTSTTLEDAIFLSKEIIQRIIQLDVLCVIVSFIDELSTLSAQTVSMVSTVVPENPALRTFKIIRMPADGLAYAISIAEKHHLTYSMIKERIAL
jgi:DNA mismatch repair protein MutS